jgi:hypothetical protein
LMILSNARSRLAEDVLARLSAMPLMEEAVFHSLRFHDTNIEKEVCDLVLLHRGDAILLSLKAHDIARDPERTTRWLGKQAPKALAQLRGAYRTLQERPTWCDHRIHGQRTFPAGNIRPRHGIALLEAEFEVALPSIHPSLIEANRSVPTSVMSVQDFVSVLNYLRTWHDLLHYVETRHKCLNSVDQCTIGADATLFGYYTVMRDTFDGYSGIADAKIVVTRGEHVRAHSAFRDRERVLAQILEDSMREIASAGPMVLPDDCEDLRAHLPDGSLDRESVREELCELSIQERAALGEQIGVLCGKAVGEGSDGPVYGGVRFTRHPTKAYLIVVGRETSHSELGVHALDLTIAGCVFHERPIGITLVLNQVGDHIQFNWYRVENILPSAEMLAAGQVDFGHIRTRTAIPAR